MMVVSFTWPFSLLHLFFPFFFFSMYFADMADFPLKAANPFPICNHCTATSLLFIFKMSLFCWAYNFKKNYTTGCILHSLAYWIIEKTCDSFLCHIVTHDTWPTSVLLKTTRKFTGTFSGGTRYYQSFPKASTEPAPWPCLCRGSETKPKPWVGRPVSGALCEGSPAVSSATVGW